MADFFVLGLDWIDSGKGWAFCRLGGNPIQTLEFGCLACTEVLVSPLVTKAAYIVVDAPIGLLADKTRVCAARHCDPGARCWLGPLTSSVFAPPTSNELQEWRRRRSAGEPQRQGHFRGLLPAINSAEELRCANQKTLESHPELVFSALAGRPLPAEGKKTLLLGLLVRIALLQRQGVALGLHHFRDVGRIPTDNFLDAVAMALVARSWHRLGDDLQVIRSFNGTAERLGDDDSRDFLMALPEIGPRALDAPPLTPEELVALASEFRAEVVAGGGLQGM